MANKAAGAGFRGSAIEVFQPCCSHKRLSPLKNVASTTMRQYVIRIRRQENLPKSGGMSPPGTSRRLLDAPVPRLDAPRRPGDTRGLTAAFHRGLPVPLIPGGGGYLDGYCPQP